MKNIFNIITMCCLMALMFVSCTDDSTINTTNAVVGMGSSTFSVKENKGIFTVPVVVTGEQNGDIKVTVKVSSTDPSCVEDKQFMVTSKNLIIPQTKKSVNVEIKAIDDRIINPDRSFIITIDKVEGAAISETASATTVILRDNDDIPYDRMDGVWTVHATDMLADEPEDITWETRLSTVVDEDSAGYGSVITMSPWRMYGGETYEGTLDIKHTMSFVYNQASQTATVSFRLGETMCEELVFGGEDEQGYNLTNCLLRSATPTQTNYTFNGRVYGTVNNDFTKITFNLPLLGVIFDANESPYSYWFYYSNIEMTREE